MDEGTKSGYVRVRVQIPNLKARGKGLLRFIGGSTDEVKNAKVICDFQERLLTYDFILKIDNDIKFTWLVMLTIALYY